MGYGFGVDKTYFNDFKPYKYATHELLNYKPRPANCIMS